MRRTVEFDQATQERTKRETQEKHSRLWTIKEGSRATAGGRQAVVGAVVSVHCKNSPTQKSSPSPLACM